MKKLIAAIALSVSASAANAIGPEAVVGALIGGIIIGQATAEPSPPPYVYYPPHSYGGHIQGHYHYAPRPVRQCFSVPLYDAYGRYVSSTRRCHYVQY